MRFAVFVLAGLACAAGAAGEWLRVSDGGQVPAAALFSGASFTFFFRRTPRGPRARGRPCPLRATWAALQPPAADTLSLSKARAGPQAWHARVCAAVACPRARPWWDHIAVGRISVASRKSRRAQPPGLAHRSRPRLPCPPVLTRPPLSASFLPQPTVVLRSRASPR
jgi:hypothetical protein